VLNVTFPNILTVSNKIFQIMYVYPKRKKRKKKHSINLKLLNKANTFTKNWSQWVGFFLYEMSEFCSQSNNVPE